MRSISSYRRVNYAFQVSKIPGLTTGAHSVILVTLRNGSGGELKMLIDAVTDKAPTPLKYASVSCHSSLAGIR